MEDCESTRQDFIISLTGSHPSHCKSTVATNHPIEREMISRTADAIHKLYHGRFSNDGRVSTMLQIMCIAQW